MSLQEVPVVRGGSRLGERLVDAKVLTGTQVAAALEEQQRTGKRLGTVLIESGTIDPEQSADEVVDTLIKRAWHGHATDVHLDAQLNTVRVRFRVDGALRDAVSLPLEQGMDVLDRVKSLGHMDVCETRRAQLGAVDLQVDGQRLDIYVATVGTALGEKATLRLLAPEKALDRLEDLGMPSDGLTLLRRLARDPVGPVICAGPKRSGRTTTLYAALAEADTADRSGFSIERHLEHVVPSVNQLQAGEPEGVTLADGIRAALHQDADVMLVDELADAETSSLAVQAAVDGRLVLAS